LILSKSLLYCPSKFPRPGFIQEPVLGSVLPITDHLLPITVHYFPGTYGSGVPAGIGGSFLSDIPGRTIEPYNMPVFDNRNDIV
jgi:hypothetical protein